MAKTIRLGLFTNIGQFCSSLLGLLLFLAPHGAQAQCNARVPCDSRASCDSLLTCCDGTSCGCQQCQPTGLLASLGGIRGSLADSGITFQNNMTQFYMGNTAGGVEREFRYAGHGDYVTNFDLGKLGVQEGLFLKTRAEHRFGESLRDATGAILPPNLAADLPVDDSERLYITNFLLTQALSESFVLFAGKMDTLDGDLNAYAHGRGIRQFSNAAFVANPIALRTVPYATLGAGFAFLLDGEPLLSVIVLNATDTAETDGFSELFAEGAALTAELRAPTNLLGLPGHQLLGATWSSRNIVALDQDPRILLPQVPIARQSGSWSLYWNCDQALVGDESRNWGLFGRAGIADDDTNPIAYFLSAGLGGSSPISGREQDSWGVGYYYSETSNQISPVLQAVLGSFGDGQGAEMFYNYSVCNAFTLTPDLQFLAPARDSVNNVVVAGVRANLAF